VQDWKKMPATDADAPAAVCDSLPAPVKRTLTLLTAVNREMFVTAVVTIAPASRKTSVLLLSPTGAVILYVPDGKSRRFPAAAVAAAWMAVVSSVTPSPFAPNHRTFTAPSNTRL
jgi:hypothetical protein